MSSKPPWLTEAELRAKMNAEEGATDPEIRKRQAQNDVDNARIRAMSVRPKILEPERFTPKRAAYGPQPLQARQPLYRNTVAGAPKKPQAPEPVWNNIEATMPEYVRIGMEKGDLKC